jgi:predicted nucleic acid-binding protein
LLTLFGEYAVGGKQIHDANIVAVMLTHEIETLVTLNVADFQRYNDKIRILSPL